MKIGEGTVSNCDLLGFLGKGLRSKVHVYPQGPEALGYTFPSCRGRSTQSVIATRIIPMLRI